VKITGAKLAYDRRIVNGKKDIKEGRIVTHEGIQIKEIIKGAYQKVRP
jgi:hypothetical protein